MNTDSGSETETDPDPDPDPDIDADRDPDPDIEFDTDTDIDIDMTSSLALLTLSLTSTLTPSLTQTRIGTWKHAWTTFSDNLQKNKSIKLIKIQVNWILSADAFFKFKTKHSSVKLTFYE
jgi:hypothetical protein